MRCPDCGTDFPVKPEVIVKTEPCKCGLTSEVRFIGRVVAAIVIIALSMSGCTAYQSYLNSRIAEKGDSIRSDGSLEKPEKK